MVDFASRAITMARAEPRESGLGWSFRDLDWVLLITIAALVGVGLWAIGGITHDDVKGSPDYYVLRQGVFGHFPIAIAGKTGTAEKLIDAGGYMRKENTAWWCGFGPFDAPELVVCAVIENGGYGGEIAAPSALEVFEKYFGIKATQVAAKQAD